MITYYGNHHIYAFFNFTFVVVVIVWLAPWSLPASRVMISFFFFFSLLSPSSLLFFSSGFPGRIGVHPKAVANMADEASPAITCANAA